MKKKSMIFRQRFFIYFKEKGLKAITPVIATVMLMLITVGMVGVTYTWFSSMMTTQTEKNIAIPVGGVQCINNRVSVVVTNAGANSNVTDDDIVVADVNGVSVRNTPFFGGFNTNGLVGYWRFEQSNGSAATNDSSGYGNMGTLTNMNLTGNTTSGLTQGRFGNALQFDGVDDYVTVSDSSSLDVTTAITVGAWVKFNALTGTRYYLVNKDYAYRLILESTPPQKIYPLIWIGGNWYEQGDNVNPNPVAGAWYHVAFTYDSSSRTIINYQNGKRGSTTTLSGLANYLIDTNSQPLKIGSSTNGVIDEVQIWNRSLTPDEITQLNKTNAGNFTMAPNRAITLINGYPVFAKGKYAVRVGTRNGVIERTVECV